MFLYNFICIIYIDILYIYIFYIYLYILYDNFILCGKFTIIHRERPRAGLWLYGAYSEGFCGASRVVAGDRPVFSLKHSPGPGIFLAVD